MRIFVNCMVLIFICPLWIGDYKTSFEGDPLKNEIEKLKKVSTSNICTIRYVGVNDNYSGRYSRIPAGRGN